MSTILIGVEASERSEDAIAFGGRLAEVSTAHVVVACAFPYNDATRHGSDPSFRESLAKQAEQTAVDMRDRITGVPADRLVIRITANTSPAHALHDLAGTEHAEIIVLGSSHTSGLGRVAPGSTAERLLHGAPCALAVIPDGYRTHAAEPIRRIGVAYDGSDEATAAVSAAVQLARAFSAELEVIGVVIPEVYASAGMMGGAAYATPQDELERSVQEGLDAVIAGLPDDVTATTRRLVGSPAEQLGERSEALDLLLAGSRGYGPLRSVLVGGVSGQLMRTARCPMVVIPRGVEAPLANLFSTAAVTTA